MLRGDEYDRWAQPYHEQVFRTAAGVPRILFVKECPYLDRMARTGAEVISLGSRHDLAAARAEYPQLVFQGNVNEAVLRTSTPDVVRMAVRACRRAGGGHRHIINLNHGVGKETPVENFAAYIQAAREGPG
jgi:uroporphyrinogen decarboxylase